MYVHLHFSLLKRSQIFFVMRAIVGVAEGLTGDAGTTSLGPVSHQVDGLGAITVSDAGTP